MTFAVNIPLGLVIAGIVVYIIMAMLADDRGIFGNGYGCLGALILLACWLLAAGVWLGQSLGGVA